VLANARWRLGVSLAVDASSSGNQPGGDPVASGLVVPEGGAYVGELHWCGVIGRAGIDYCAAVPPGGFVLGFERG
jgi:hypothetical protein